MSVNGKVIDMEKVYADIGRQKEEDKNGPLYLERLFKEMGRLRPMERDRHANPSLEGLSLLELNARLDRMERMLAGTDFVQRLPDRGDRLRAKIEQIRQRIQVLSSTPSDDNPNIDSITMDMNNINLSSKNETKRTDGVHKFKDHKIQSIPLQSVIELTAKQKQEEEEHRLNESKRLLSSSSYKPTTTFLTFGKAYAFSNFIKPDSSEQSDRDGHSSSDDDLASEPHASQESDQ